MKEVRNSVALSLVFIWIGFVCAISFMEAWLKFTAPGITLPLGLGIGRIVFSALNHVEWSIILVMIISIFFKKEHLTDADKLALIIALVILLLQTFILLPGLDSRAEAIIAGKELSKSNLHIYYVISEVIKVFCLVVYGIKQFRSVKRNN